MRTTSPPAELKEACALAHSMGRRVYVTLNAFARDEDLQALPQLLEQAAEAEADALIVNDPGVIRMAKEMTPHMPLHLSTQANTLNAQAARFLVGTRGEADRAGPGAVHRTDGGAHPAKPQGAGV